MLLTPFSADASDERTQNFVKKYQENSAISEPVRSDVTLFIRSIRPAITPGYIFNDHQEICDKLIEQFTTMTYDGLTGAGMTWAPPEWSQKSPAE